MPDREKVIKHFEHLLNAAKGNYQDFVDLTVDAGEEILALLKEQQEQIDKLLEEYASNAEMAEGLKELLKEQEAEKPNGHWKPYEPDKRGYTDGFTCSRCERVILSDHYCKMIDFNFCPYCGAYMDNAEGR